MTTITPSFFAATNVFCLALAFVGGNANAIPVHGQGTWETTLQDRDLNGDGTVDAFYDVDLDITWMSNADSKRGYAFQSQYARDPGAGVTNNWRYPYIKNLPVNYDGSCAGWLNDGFCGVNPLAKVGDTIYSELAHLWYVTLGNSSGYLSNTGAFTGFGLTNYWLGNWHGTGRTWEAIGDSPNVAFSFNNAGGSQGIEWAGMGQSAMFVMDGDVGAPVKVPEPDTLALIGLGLLGLIVARRPLKT